MKKTAKMYSTTFTVDNNTLEIKQNGKILKPYFNKGLKRWYLYFKDDNGKPRMCPRARVICQAFNPNKDCMKLQADHIDNNTTNDSPENLQWLTRQQNNAKDHARMMKSLHKKTTNRNGQVIEARKGDEVKIFQNGYAAANALGCSHVLVYNVLNKKHFAKTACGWTLKWIDFENDLKIEERQIKMTSTTIKKQIKKIEGRISIWKDHIAKLSDKASKKIEAIKKKIDVLEAYAEALKSAKTLEDK